MSEVLNNQGVTREEVKKYLDDLREEGVTNMFGAGSYLRIEFGFSKPEAKAEVVRWMNEFGKVPG